MSSRLSSEMLHATTVTRDGHAEILAGRSGSGKSDLALRLLDRGFVLVSDDQTMIRKSGDWLFASAPPTIRGKLEIQRDGRGDQSVRQGLLPGIVRRTLGLSRRPTPVSGSRELQVLRRRIGRRAIIHPCGGPSRPIFTFAIYA